MKLHGLLAIVLSIFFAWIPASASNVGTGLISQLTYLGDASQPDRIPLSPVIYNANYNYGAHSAMFESRPCYHGHFLAGGRPEYEQNLAVIYGISCDLSDPTQLQGSTATFALKKTQVPENAPYTQEQVFAASLQTLLLYTGGVSQEHPLTVKVIAEGMPQPEWTVKYAKDYFFTKEDIEKSKSGDVKLKPLAVPGITIDDTSVPGVTYLVIDHVKPDPKITPAHPVFVPFMSEGEAESIGTALVPVWPGTSWNEPLGVLTRPVLPYYEKWYYGTKRFVESGAMPHQPPPLLPSQRINLEITKDESLISVLINGSAMNSQQFAAIVHACVFSVRPTEKQPLEIVIADGTIHDEYRALLKNDPAWKEGTSCRFVLDAKTMKFIKGSVPGYVLNTEWGGLMIELADNGQPVHGDPESAPPWLSDSLVKISETLQAVAEKDHEFIIRSSKAKLSKWASEGKGEIDDILVTMLTLHRYQNDPTFFETLWWRDQHRVTRAIAAHFANQGFLDQGVLVRPQLEKNLDRMHYYTWEQRMRSQELSHFVQMHIGKAVEAWGKRCEKEP